MHIGFDAKRFFFNNSGLGNYSRGVVRILAEYYPENQYTLFSPREGNPNNFPVPAGSSVVYPSGAFWKKFSSVWRSYRMGESVKSRGIDIFHGLSNELPADITQSGAKSVLTMHDIIFIHFPELYKPFDRYIYTKKYRSSCEKADRIIAISKQTKGDLVNTWGINPDNIDIVYQGCDPIFYRQAGKEERAAVKAKYGLPENYIVSVGTIEERKNLMLTVKAMAEHGIGHDMDLVACGRRTPYADKIMEYAQSKNIAHRIHFIHNVSFADLPAIYQMAKVSVYASFYEGFGIPILEAFNSGIPVITTEGGVFPETGGNAAMYINPYDTEQMAVALKDIINDNNLRQLMISKGLDYAANFRDDKIARDLMAVYSKLL